MKKERKDAPPKKQQQIKFKERCVRDVPAIGPERMFSTFQYEMTSMNVLYQPGREKVHLGTRPSCAYSNNVTRQVLGLFASACNAET